jgi:hypothetical protein
MIVRHIAHTLDVFGSDHSIRHNGRILPDECSKSFSECLLRHGEGSFTQSPRRFQADFLISIIARIALMIDRLCGYLVERRRAPLSVRNGNAARSPAEVKTVSDQTKETLRANANEARSKRFSKPIGMNWMS